MQQYFIAVGGANERKRRAKKEIKQECTAPQGNSSASTLPSLRDPTPSEAVEIIKGEKEKYKEDASYHLPRHHRSPARSARRSPRPKRVNRKDASIDRLFLECNQEYQQICDEGFWDPVIVGPIQTTSAPTETPLPTAGTSIPATLTSAPLQIKEELPQPVWYDNSCMTFQGEDIYMSSPSEAGELLERPFVSTSADLILPLMTAEDVTGICGSSGYDQSNPDAMEVDQLFEQEYGSQSRPISVSSGASPVQRRNSGTSTPYIAPSDSSPPFSPAYAVPSSNLLTPPYSPHSPAYAPSSPAFAPRSPSTSPPPQEANQNFSFEVSAERMRELLVELQENGVGYTPLQSPPADSFLTGTNPMLAATPAPQDAAVTSTSPSLPATTEGIRERLEKVKTQQQDCKTELEQIAGFVSRQRKLLDKEDAGSRDGSVTRDQQARVHPVASPEPRRDQAAGASSSTRNPINLSWKQDSDNLHSDIWNILPQIFDPFSETPIQYEKGIHGIRLSSTMIKNNDEFLVKWRKMGASLFSFVVNNCKDIEFLTGKKGTPEEIRRAMREIIQIFMKQRNSEQMQAFLNENRIPSVKERHDGEWFPALVELTSMTPAWHEVLRYQQISTKPWIDKGTALLYVTIFSAPLSQRLILPALSNGLCKQTNFLTHVPKAVIIPCLGYEEFWVQDDLAILRFQLHLIAGLVVLRDEGEFFDKSTNLHHLTYLSTGFCLPKIERELYFDQNRSDRNTLSLDLFKFIFAKRPAPACWRGFFTNLLEQNLSTYNRGALDAKRSRLYNRRGAGKYHYKGFGVQRPIASNNWRKDQLPYRVPPPGYRPMNANDKDNFI